MPPSYKTINSITLLYVYAWNNSVVNILVGTDEHGHRRDNTDVSRNSTRRLTSSLTNIPNIVIVSSYVPTQSYDDED